MVLILSPFSFLFPYNTKRIGLLNTLSSSVKLFRVEIVKKKIQLHVHFLLRRYESSRALDGKVSIPFPVQCERKQTFLNSAQEGRIGLSRMTDDGRLGNVTRTERCCCNGSHSQGDGSGRLRSECGSSDAGVQLQ